MQRTDNKLERIRKEDEDMDRRLKEAGMYEDNLSQEMKARLLKFLEESRETARQEEEERLNFQRWEQKVLADTLNTSSTYQESVDSTSSSSSSSRTGRRGIEMVRQHKGKADSSTNNESDVVLSARPHHSGGKPSRNNLNQPPAHTHHEEEDLTLVTEEGKVMEDPECQVISTTTPTPTPSKDSFSTPVKVCQPGKRKYWDRDGSSHTPGSQQVLPSTLSMVRGRSKIHSNTTPTTTTPSSSSSSSSSTTVTVDDDIEPHPATSNHHQSSKAQHTAPHNANVLFVPLSQSSPRKNTTVLPLTKGDVTPQKSVTTPRKASVLSNKQDESATNITVIEDCSSLRCSPQSSGSSTPTLSLDTCSTRNSPSIGNVTPSQDAALNTPSKKLRTITLTKDLASTSVRRVIVTSPVKNTSHYTPSICPSSITTSTTTALPSVATSTTTTSTSSTTTTTLISSDKEPTAPGSSVDSLSESELEDKSTLRAAVLRSINVFSSRPVHEVSLKRKLSLPSESPHKVFHKRSDETPHQCRDRILTLINNTAVCLLRYQSSLPALAWSKPLTVDRRLKNSLDRIRPAPRQKSQHQQAEGSTNGQEPRPRATRQAARCSRGASKTLSRPCRGEEAAGVSRGVGLRRGKTVGSASLPRIMMSDSDTDLEIDSVSPSLPSSPQNTSMPCPTKATGTPIFPNPTLTSKGESQPVQRRKTFRLDSDSESSDNECFMEADVRRSNNKSGSSSHVNPGGGGGGGGAVAAAAAAAAAAVAVARREAAASSTDSLTELCIIEEEPHTDTHRPARPAGRNVARRGARRPAQGSASSAPSKLRKTQNINKDKPGEGRDSQPTTTHLSQDSPDVNCVMEDASGEDGGRRQTNEVVEEEEEEMVSCPICQGLFPQQKIVVHASDCVGQQQQQEQEQQQQQQSNPTTTRRQRKMNEEAAGSVATTSTDGNTKECNKVKRCNLCQEVFHNTKDLQRHINSCSKVEDDDIFCRNVSSSSSSSSSSITQGQGRRGGRGVGRPPSQEVSRGKRGGFSKPRSLLANTQD